MKKKIILYSLLYMVISIASAFGAIQISSFLQNNAGSSSETPPYQLVKIVDNITASERIDADINLNLSSPEANYNLTIDANLDMSDSENTELGLDVNLVSNDSAVFDISVEYLDSVVYMQFGDQCLSFRAENLFQSILLFCILSLKHLPNAIFGSGLFLYLVLKTQLPYVLTNIYIPIKIM